MTRTQKPFLSGFSIAGDLVSGSLSVPAAQGLCPHCQSPLTPLPSLMAEDKPQSMLFGSLSEAISSLAHAVCGLAREVSHHNQASERLSVSARLAQIDERLNIMATAIQQFAEKQNAFNERVDVAVSGLGTDIQVLNDKINELQNSPGAITPEDQALLDALQARGETIATKLEALDALTPPPPPAG